MRLLETEPDEPKQGDVFKFDDTWKVYNDDKWDELGKATIEWSDISAAVNANISSDIERIGSLENDVADLSSNKADVSSVEEVENSLSNYLPLSGGLLTNTLSINATYPLYLNGMPVHYDSVDTLILSSGYNRTHAYIDLNTITHQVNGTKFDRFAYVYSDIAPLCANIQVLESQLSGLEGILHEINTGSQS